MPDPLFASALLGAAVVAVRSLVAGPFGCIGQVGTQLDAVEAGQRHKALHHLQRRIAATHNEQASLGLPEKARHLPPRWQGPQRHQAHQPTHNHRDPPHMQQRAHTAHDHHE